MLRVFKIITLLAVFTSFEIASAQNWWKESSLNWLNSPQRKFNQRRKENSLNWLNSSQFKYHQRWKKSSLYWLNSPQRRYYQRWKQSPLYWRNVQESRYERRIYGEYDDDIIQINLLFDPLQEDYVLENQGEVTVNDNQEKKKPPSKPHMETIDASKKEKQLSDQQRQNSGEEGNYIIVYSSESIRKYYLDQMKDQGIEINGAVVYGMNKRLR